jgi:hypothetical protein
VRELATFTSETLGPGVVVFAWEILVHVQTLVLLSTAIQHIKLAQLVLSRRRGVVRVRAVIALKGTAAIERRGGKKEVMNVKRVHGKAWTTDIRMDYSNCQLIL